MNFNKPDAYQPTILHKQSPIKPLKSQRHKDLTNRKNCEMFKVNADSKRRLSTHFSLENATLNKPNAGLRLPKIDSIYTTVGSINTNTVHTEMSSPPSISAKYQTQA